jgi:hypothetical protein
MDVVPEEIGGRDAVHGDDLTILESLIERGEERVMEQGIGRQ